MKKPFPSQKHHVLTKLEMARSGQGWRRLKTCLAFLSAKIRSRGSSRQTFGVTESRTPIIITNRSLTSIPNMAPVCQESGTRQGLCAFASSSLCSLVAPSASLSQSSQHQIHPGAFTSPSFAPFSFFSSLPSSSPPSFTHVLYLPHSSPPSSSFISSILFFLLLHLLLPSPSSFSKEGSYLNMSNTEVEIRETLKTSLKDT